MTAKTFFNKGIYKSTVKRFFIGSLLYFLMLFAVSGLIILLSFEPGYNYQRRSLLLTGGIFDAAFAITICVPTVVAILVYRFAHSKKQSVFTHSMPVSREANYFSTLLASFTLMAVPIILNGLILMAISLGGYGTLFDISSCFEWMGMLLLTIFIMFAFSTFSAMVTANSFAVIVINILIYILLPMLTSVTELVFDRFLFGYAYDMNITDALLDINPLSYLAYTANDIAWGEAVNFGAMACFMIAAVAVYAVSLVLYKRRHLEMCGDVAAFRVLNHIFKYLVTFVGTYSVFAIFSTIIEDKPFMFVFVVIAASILLYFACEMILTKQIKVLYAYKGYLAFAAVFAIFVAYIAFSGAFGYEGYVPSAEDIKTAAIYNYYYQDIEPFTDSEKINSYVVNVHQELVDKENRTVLNYNNSDTRIHIVYELKDGRRVARRYGVTYEKRDEIMNTLYQYPEYKYACEEVFRNDIRSVIEVNVNDNPIKGTIDELYSLLECVRSDITSLGYFEIHPDSRDVYIASINFGYLTGEEWIHYMNVNITEDFTNTINWIKDAGYDKLVDINRVVSGGEAAETITVTEPNSSVIYIN